MALGPIEVNLPVTRAQDYSAMKTNEDMRPNIQQMDLGYQGIREADLKTTNVQKKDEANNEQKKQDAKEEGKNKYMGDGGKNRQNRKNHKEGTVIKIEQAGFDFRI